MILVLILSAANQNWLSAVLHLAVLTLLQLLAVWANRRWAASRAAQAQNDPAKLVQHGHYTPCPKGRKLTSLVLRILLGRACIWMWLVGLYSIIVWDLHYVPPFDADLPPAAWHWRFPFVVTLLLGLNVVMSIIHITNNQLREFAAARSVHGLGVAIIAAAEVLQIFLPLVVAYFALPVLNLPVEADMFGRKLILMLLIGSIGFAIIRTAKLLATKLARQHELIYSSYTEHVRALQTEYSLLYRVTLVVVSIVTIACMLLVFETVRRVGTSLLASAGLIGIVAGIAAQRSLANLFAGVQLALTQPILLGDVIEVEGDHGVVEQITITYVVIRQGDLRRLVLPISYFLEKPFRNWTKLSSEVVGSIKLFLDFRTPLQPLRNHLDSVLQREPLWNGKSKSVEITDIQESHMIVEVLVSANTPDDLRSLCVKVREDLIQYLIASKSFGLPNIPP